jgi:hypothetical protein
MSVLTAERSKFHALPGGAKPGTNNLTGGNIMNTVSAEKDFKLIQYVDNQILQVADAFDVVTRSDLQAISTATAMRIIEAIRNAE